jgi:hippurate hydrolase
MKILDGVAKISDEAVVWRRHLHTIPETSFEEVKTSEFAGKKLAEFGLEVHRGIGKTGVVATLKNGEGRTIGLRADMDALDVQEAEDAPYRSTHPGKMHACGHDGHVAMLLGAAKYLAATRQFKGTVRFIVQPAEETGSGAKAMLEDGLFKRFPVDSVFAIHNWPECPFGTFGIRPDQVQASYDRFDITLKGRGGHAASPYLGVDPIVMAAETTLALQTVISRNIHPLHSGVVSVTQIHAGTTYNVIPDEVVLRGTTRAFLVEVRDTLERSMRRIVEGVAATHGGSGHVNYMRGNPPTINHAAQAEIAAQVAAEIVGAENVDRTILPTMGSEDFSYMLLERPGCYVWVGNGGAENDRGLHKPVYMFNDEIIPIGVTFWARLVQKVLG